MNESASRGDEMENLEFRFTQIADPGNDAEISVEVDKRATPGWHVDMADTTKKIRQAQSESMGDIYKELLREEQEEAAKADVVDPTADGKFPCKRRSVQYHREPDWPEDIRSHETEVICKCDDFVGSGPACRKCGHSAEDHGVTVPPEPGQKRKAKEQLRKKKAEGKPKVLAQPKAARRPSEAVLHDGRCVGGEPSCPRARRHLQGRAHLRCAGRGMQHDMPRGALAREHRVEAGKDGAHYQ